MSEVEYLGGVAVRLFTIGYEGRSLEELLDKLAGAGVERLIDVRELPLSRRRGFSKTRLRTALGEVGIDYIHMRALGNPKENRDRYRAGDVTGGANVYRRRLANGSDQALADLAVGLDRSKACLLCYERDHTQCHRDVIVEALRVLGADLEVNHL